MGALIDLVGRRFGALVVISRAGSYEWGGKKHGPIWRCRCDCGREVEVRGAHLRINNTQSCGHLRSELLQKIKATHGENRRLTGATPEYRAWKGMINRCENRNGRTWKHYGGRGIKVCDAWRRDFRAFLEHVGRKPSPKHSIDRINNNGDYEPGNVRWAMQVVQVNNSRRWSDNHMEKIDGHNLCP